MKKTSSNLDSRGSQLSIGTKQPHFWSKMAIFSPKIAIRGLCSPPPLLVGIKLMKKTDKNNLSTSTLREGKFSSYSGHFD